MTVHRTGDRVIYHGSVTEAHGPAVVVSECPCGTCQVQGLTRYILTGLETGLVLSHVRAGSFHRE